MAEMVLPKTPSFRLDGKRALITGASRGIGLAGACALAEVGAHVFLAARSLDQVEALAKALNERGQKATALQMDVTDIAATAKKIADFGPFDILFNNAGAAKNVPLEDINEDDFDFVMDINVKAAYFVARAVAMGMKEAGISGSIINTSSQMGVVGGQRRTTYCASKHAVEGFTKAMAIELGPLNIRVNSIGPTFIRTELTKGVFENPEQLEWVLSKIKLNRVGEVEDIMGPLVFLASEASSLVTGTCLLVDGGWTAD